MSAGGATPSPRGAQTCGERSPRSGAAGVPVVPDGLGEAGASLWTAITAEYDLRPDELALLRSFCEVTDECRSLRQAIAEQGLTVAGSRGQVRPHPLLGALAQSRAMQVRLAAQLGLPDDDEDAAKATPASRQASRAARARWAGHEKIARESPHATA